MNRKFLTSAVVAASLLAPAVAFAQSESAAPPAESKTEAAPPKAVHHAKATHVKHSSTVGMSSSTARSRPGGEPVSRKTSD
jgi:hypothetical protein